MTILSDVQTKERTYIEIIKRMLESIVKSFSAEFTVLKNRNFLRALQILMFVKTLMLEKYYVVYVYFILLRNK